MNLAQQMQDLYSRFGQLPGITIELQKELLAVGVRNKGGAATVFLQGAQIAEFTPAGQRPILWMSQENRFKQGTPLRGGIPVCWPWFGDLQRNPEPVQQQFSGSPSHLSKSAHGLARAQLWQLDTIEVMSESTTRLQLSLPASALEVFTPLAKCTLKLQIDVSDTLTCQLTTTNHSDTTLSFSQALHTYLAVADVSDIRIEQLDGCTYLDTLNIDEQGQWQPCTHQGDVTISGETDRIYLDCPDTLLLHDPVWKRRIQLRTQGSRSAIVWNPWIAKAKRLSDFADDDYLSMICIETANADKDHVTLNAGDSHPLSVELSAQ